MTKLKETCYYSLNVQLENRPELKAPNWRTPAIKQLYIELKDSLSLKRWRVLVLNIYHYPHITYININKFVYIK